MGSIATASLNDFCTVADVSGSAQGKVLQNGAVEEGGPRVKEKGGQEPPRLSKMQFSRDGARASPRESITTYSNR